MVSCGFNNENLIEMKIQIENLMAQIRGVQLNGYQRALALDEYYKLLDYVEELEQLTIPTVSGSLPSLDDATKVAVRISEEAITPPPDAKEQAMFIAGFQECIKWLNVFFGNDR